jgi:dTDP-4-dehydrorhamnose 3,5-epimerase
MVTPTTEDVGIQGVRLVRLVAHADERGSLTETYRREWLPRGREVVQANLSVSRPGVLRGLHWHRRQADYWCVLSGTAYVALVDLREGSPTRLARFERRVDAERERFGLAIPPGVAHGFHAETEVLLLYLVDSYYSGQDEHGLAWDDPELDIAWPSRSPILSERDRSNPSLTQVLRDPPPFAEPRG